MDSNKNNIDLGSGYAYRFIRWAPDRELNPEYHDLPDVERYGAIFVCPHAEGMIVFASDVQRRIDPKSPAWTVESWDPLTISPSVLRSTCGCHGFIRGGKWVKA